MNPLLHLHIIVEIKEGFLDLVHHLQLIFELNKLRIVKNLLQFTSMPPIYFTNFENH